MPQRRLEGRRPRPKRGALRGRFAPVLESDLVKVKKLTQFIFTGRVA